MHRIATWRRSSLRFQMGWGAPHMLEAYLPSSFLPMMIQVMSVILHGFWTKKKVKRGGNMLALSTPKTWLGGGYRWDPASNISAVSSSQDSILYKSDSINDPDWSTLQYSFHIRCVEYEWINSAKESTHHFTGFLSFGPPENLFHLSVPKKKCR